MVGAAGHGLTPNVTDVTGVPRALGPLPKSPVALSFLGRTWPQTSTRSSASIGAPTPTRSRRRIAKLAAQLHPDKNLGDKKAESRFKAVNRAHQILSDPEKRKLYDEFGEDGVREGFDAQAARAYRDGFGGGRVRYRNPQGGSVEDLFEEPREAAVLRVSAICSATCSAAARRAAGAAVPERR